MNPRLSLSLLVVLVIGLSLSSAEPKTPPEGVRPLGADGKPLNLDFETGTLQDWKAEGEAFIGQPVKGDTVASRRGDMKSQHQGDYWIGGYELRQDRPQGTLTSVPFKVTHPWASFLVGGGPWPETCVELVRNDTKEVISRTSGLEEENLRRVAVDLRPHLGKEIFIRLVDRRSGHWGHVNFDDFRFHADRPAVPPRPPRQAPLSLDVYKNAGLTPEKAAQAMTVPDGFQVKLAAGEPDVHQPIALCLDDRGRVWVAEAYCYPVRQPEGKGRDRILIFEDVDGDGKFDKRTIFLEGLNLVSGLEVGFGGVWIGAAPYLLFVPLRPGEDKPAGPPQVLLDGWHYEDTHETLNTFTWGPDGWLYGCHGVFTHSRVGKLGTPDAKRQPLNAGVWRYHPTKHIFEVFAHGTSNPWGLDFDEYGQAFVEACVIPHAFHIIQGGRYLRQAGAHFNPYTYADIDTIADHRHYLGATPHGGNERSDAAGGGHAHCGLMIYQGGAWPAEYRGKMFIGNIHGRRLNMDILKRKGSGYVASHGPDFLLANDAWARFINFRYGPDGNVYLIDWYDKQACHRNEPEIWDRSNGRIYKICYRGTRPVQVDLSKKSDEELVELQLHDNDWYVRHARRLLAERQSKKVHEALAKIAFGHKDETRRLRGLWALHVTGGLNEERVLKGLADEGAYVRGWTIQLALEDGKASATLLAKLAEMARKDPSPVVRLYLASGLQRLPLEQRWEVLRGLVAHAEDAGDPNLPLMYWYAAEPLAGLDASRALHLASEATVPPLLAFMVRRISSAGTPEAVATLVAQLAKTADTAKQRTILQGLQAGLKGRRQLAMPPDWAQAYRNLANSSDAEVRALARSLAVTFGDAAAFAEMRRTLASPKADLRQRQAALTALLEARDRELAPLLHELLKDAALRGAAIRALADYDDPRTPAALLAVYPALSATEKRDALNTLASRVAYGRALMEAVAAKKVPAADLPAETVRQLRNLKDTALDSLIAQFWGAVRSTTPADRARLIADYRRMLTRPYPPPADLSLGRAVFAKVCAQCHTLYGVGGKLAPDITGSNRADLNYLLENILDPSAVVPNDYKVSIVELTNGKVLTGIVRDGNPGLKTVTLSDATVQTVAVKDIENLKATDNSMMPDDLLKTLSEHEVRSLIAYLRYPNQVPMLATADNAKDFFNGKDLAGWDGDSNLWSVENGEIVGKSPGLKHNAFLRSHLTADDFRLTLKVKLVPNKENSGIQFRSEVLPGGDVKGLQADIGEGWWGKLYEEHGRGLLWDRSGEKFVKSDDWNEYVIEATGQRVRTWINGHLCVDLTDPAFARRGIFAVQIHSGGPMEVRFKDLKLEVGPPAGRARNP